jgi:hypothetical protein
VHPLGAPYAPPASGVQRIRSHSSVQATSAVAYRRPVASSRRGRCDRSPVDGHVDVGLAATGDERAPCAPPGSRVSRSPVTVSSGPTAVTRAAVASPRRDVEQGGSDHALALCRGRGAASCEAHGRGGRGRLRRRRQRRHPRAATTAASRAASGEAGTCA